MPLWLVYSDWIKTGKFACVKDESHALHSQQTAHRRVSIASVGSTALVVDDQYDLL